LEQQRKAAERQRLKENSRRTEEVAKKAFPNEKWVNGAVLKLEFKSNNENDPLYIPSGINRITVAKSRLTGLKNDEKTLAKEIRQGKILMDRGSLVYLLPKLKAPDGSDIKGPDAVLNGLFYEFKTITGKLAKVERRFRESRGQSENVYLKIDNKTISREEVVSRIRAVLRDPMYTGGTNGNMIVYLAQTEKAYFFRIKDLQ
jgi:hypothetical protein